MAELGLAKMNISRLVLGMVSTNCYIISNEETGEAIIFDPADNAKVIREFCKNNNLVLKAIFLTHGHFDHILAVEELRRTVHIPVYACKEEKIVLEHPEYNCCTTFGVDTECKVVADHFLEDGEIIHMAGFTFKMIHTPGHTIGGCCYYFEDYSLLISGDTLFYCTIGRTDLPTGNYEVLKNSVKEKLFVLPKETKVLPGHEKDTTIGFEIEHNMEV